MINIKSNWFVGASLGVMYGLMIRVVFDWKLLSGALEIISTGFLIFAPFSVGAIAVYFSLKESKHSVLHALKISVMTMLFFLGSMFLLLLEGVICIVLVSPVFMLAAIVGGVMMSLIIKYTHKGATAVKGIALLPVLLSAMESQLPVNPAQGRVLTSIDIEANAENIFKELYSVETIRADELGFSFLHLIGLPRPIEAQMNATGVGAVRLSRWDKGVSFQERITEWSPPYKMSYDFIIPKGSIPREALDQHVELGGDYFTVLNGGYSITCASFNRCTLSLQTVYSNRSRLLMYGNTWANIVLSDFHYSILVLMKNRAESNAK